MPTRKNHFFPKMNPTAAEKAQSANNWLLPITGHGP